jgi:hypothetical protein
VLEAYGQMQPPPRSRICKPQALEPMVKLYEAWGKPDQAAQLRARSTASSDSARTQDASEAKVP